MRKERYGLFVTALVFLVSCFVLILLFAQFAQEIDELPDGETVTEEYGGVGALAFTVSVGMFFVLMIATVFGLWIFSVLGFITSLLGLRQLQRRSLRIACVIVCSLHGTLTVISALPFCITMITILYSILF